MQFTRRALISLALIFSLANAAVAADVIAYTITPDAAKKEFTVTMTIPRVQPGTLRLQIPTWAPGSYRVGNWYSNIKDITAKSSTTPLTITHPDKLTWEVENASGEITVTYRVTNADLQLVDGKPKRGHIVGVRTFLYVPDRKEEQTTLTINAPDGWKVTNSLDPVRREENAPNSFTYIAPTYDVLVDAPTEMGDFAEDNFEVRGVPHKIVLYGDYAHLDRKKFTEMCKTLAETQTAFFNDIPYHRYVYHFNVRGARGGGGGGLEHLGSTEISFAGQVNNNIGSLISHEFFHLWNVKRIRPAVLGPFDYTGPNRTRNLWWSEGVTSYYGDLMMRRGNIYTDDQYLEHLATTIAQLQASPARLTTTVENSSLNVWEGNPFGGGGLSYYVKGELMGLCLDLKIRQVTKGQKSLDDVIRYLYLYCGKGNWPGFDEDEIRSSVSRMAGQDISAFYDNLARTTDEMPFKECLGYVGLDLDEGTKVIKRAATGMSVGISTDGKALTARFVFRDGAAAKAGLKTDDRIVEINGKPASTQADVLKITSAEPGAKMKITVERDGKKETLDYTVGVTERKVWSVKPSPNATEEQVRLRKAWLAGN